MTIRTRLEKLEALNPACEIKTIFCFPTNAFNPERPISHNWNEVELAPGVYTSVHETDGAIHYDSLETVRGWLSLSAQKDDAGRIYKVVSQAECDRIGAEFEAMC